MEVEEEQEKPHSAPMEERSSSSSSSSSTTKIIQKSIHLFLQNYHYFTFTYALLIFPYSITYLLSQHQTLFSSSLNTHFKTLFSAANFPDNSINLKLSQTISSSLISLPFTLTSFLLSKTLIFHTLNPNRTSSAVSNYLPILRTYICSWLVLLSSNATVFFLLFFAFNAFQRIPLSQTFMTSFGVIVYCIVVVNAMAVCGLGFVVSGVEGVGGSDAIIKACILIRGKASTAVLLAVPVNLGFAAMEGLFRIRVSRWFFHGRSSSSSALIVGAAEGAFIGYVYSVLIVVEAIVTYVFYKNCCCRNPEDDDEEEDSSRYHQLNIYTSDRAKESMLL